MTKWKCFFQVIIFIALFLQGAVHYPSQAVTNIERDLPKSQEKTDDEVAAQMFLSTMFPGKGNKSR